jgi:anaerobic C4-dicarboxylate transporter
MHNYIDAITCVLCGWLDRPVVSNVVVFQDDIGAFVAVFGRFWLILFYFFNKIRQIACFVKKKTREAEDKMYAMYD